MSLNHLVNAALLSIVILKRKGIPWHQLRIVYSTHLNVVISDSQSTKHRVTLFSLCSANPRNSPYLDNSFGSAVQRYTNFYDSKLFMKNLSVFE